MRVLFVPFALLLLALCRTSATPTWSIVSTNTKSSSSNVAFSKPADAAKVKEQLEKPKGTALDEARLKKVVEKMGNFVFLYGLVQGGVALPKEIAKAFVNGMACEADQDEIKDGSFILAEIYEGTYNDAKHDDEEAFAKNKANFAGNERATSNCEKAAADRDHVENCFCPTKAKSMIQCLYDVAPTEAAPKKTCQAAALTALKTAGTGELGKIYDLDAYDSNAAFKDLVSSQKIDAITADADKSAKQFCDSLNTNVETAVKNLFASSGLYWLAESTFYALVFGPAESSLPDICADPEFAASAYGKCVCKFETGFTFCIYKTLAELFKTAGFLKCDPATPETATLDDTKKSAVVVPKLAAKKVVKKDEGGSSSADDAKSNAPLGAFSMLAVGLAALFTATRH